MNGLVLDVGNTHVHAVWFGGAGRVDDAVESARVFVGAGPARAGLQGRIPTRWVVGAVHPRVERLVDALVQDGAPTPHRIRGAGDFPMVVAVRAPERVGVDRLAAALAAQRHGRREAVVVDFGTAVTVDWVRADGSFEGGAIAAGREATLAGLAGAAAQLPRVALGADARRSPFPGRSTEEAMAAAIDIGLVASIDGLVTELRSRAQDPELWLTGGDAGWYRARSRFRFRFDPHLVARGIWAAAGESSGELR